MTSTQVETTGTTVTAVVAVRIPCDSEASLETAAGHRLGHVDGVRTVTIEQLRGLEPQLSATVVTVAATIDCALSVTELRDSLADTVTVDSVDQVVKVDS